MDDKFVQENKNRTQFTLFPTKWNEYVSKSKIQYMKGLLFTFLLVSLFQCGKDGKDTLDELIGCEQSSCETEAMVVDMTGLDGCGLMFQLTDGTRLEPERRTYVTAPSKTEDPLYHFDLKAGQRVKISWEESLALSTCMGGRIVFVTCITECKKPAE